MKYTFLEGIQAAGSSHSYIRGALCGEEEKVAKETGESVYEVLNRLVMESPTDGLTKDERKFGSKNGKLRLSIAQAEFSVAIFF